MRKFRISTIRLFLLLLSFGLSGCVSFPSKNVFDSTVVESHSLSQNFEIIPEEIVQEVFEVDLISIRGEDSPWSFDSFMKGDYIGTDFNLGSLLADRPKHQSYYATYMSNGLKISATWHVPKTKGPHPVVILNHGYFPPDLYTNGYGFGREQKYLADRGYAVLHIDYRGYGFSDKDPDAHHGQRFGYIGYATDALNAVYALQAADLPNIDIKKIAMLGHSMGGGVTLSAITAQPNLLSAAVIWGSTSSDYQKNFEQWSRDRLTDQAKKIFEEDFGPFDDSNSFKALSSQTYFNRVQTPLSVHHGTLDADVPVDWSRETVAVLKSLDKIVDYTEYDGYGHVFWGEDWNNVMERSEQFLRIYLFD
jgi:dipeptidyl aminopeptidase/acylaminoacyl peptidase